MTFENFEIRQEAIHPPSHYKHPVEYVNGKRYLDYHETSFERRNWHKFRETYDLRNEIESFFTEPSFIIPGRLSYSKLPEEHRKHVEKFIEAIIDGSFIRGKSLLLDFHKFIDSQ